MTALRLSQTVAETISLPDNANVRLFSESAEVINTVVATGRLTRIMAESVSNVVASARLARVVVEVISSNNSALRKPILMVCT